LGASLAWRQSIGTSFRILRRGRNELGTSGCAKLRPPLGNLMSEA
jgi:hypothetical protein